MTGGDGDTFLERGFVKGQGIDAFGQLDPQQIAAGRVRHTDVERKKADYCPPQFGDALLIDAADPAQVLVMSR
jgi:hypothetical protein